MRAGWTLSTNGSNNKAEKATTKKATTTTSARTASTTTTTTNTQRRRQQQQVRQQTTRTIALTCLQLRDPRQPELSHPEPGTNAAYPRGQGEHQPEYILFGPQVCRTAPPFRLDRSKSLIRRVVVELGSRYWQGAIVVAYLIARWRMWSSDAGARWQLSLIRRTYDAGARWQRYVCCCGWPLGR